MKGSIPAPRSRRAAALLAALLALPAHAQFFQRLFNPEVRVTLTHPPGLGLKVARVAFLPSRDARSGELASAFIADLSATGEVELLDRGDLDRLLQEQKFSNSGLVDGATAVELGKLLGSPVLVSVTVHTLRTQEQPLTSKYQWKDDEGRERQGTRYTSRTQADLSASVQAVDSATGRVYRALRLAANPYLEEVSTLGEPAFPSSTEVKALAIQQACTEVRRMLLPWHETRKLIFYDDKDYGMKEAYFRLQADDGRGALVKSMEALDKARADPRAKTRHLSRTNYNLGLCQFILGDYDAALPHLKVANDLEPGSGIFRESLGECQRALRLKVEMAQVDTRSAGFAPRAPEAAPAKAGPSLEERLERLERLKEKGLVTPKEYQERKAELLKEI